VTVLLATVFYYPINIDITVMIYSAISPTQNTLENLRMCGDYTRSTKLCKQSLL